MVSWIYQNPLKSLAVIIVVFTSALMYKQGTLRHWLKPDIRGFEGKTTGVIVSVSPVTMQLVGRFGRRIQIEKFAVTYTYSVASRKYVGTDSIFNRTENDSFIQQILHDRDAICVRYNPDRPEISFLEN